MSRVLFVVPPLTGHTNPTVSVATELVSRGHTVAWVGHPGAISRLLPAGATLFACDDAVPNALMTDMRTKSASVRGLSGLKFLWEDFLLPLARAMVPQVEAAVSAFQPDLLVVDQQALAGGIVARRHRLAWATSATTSAGVVEPLAGLPKVAQWLAARQAALQREFGLTPLDTPDLSPHAVLVFSTRALVGPREFPSHFSFVGPSISARTQAVPFPWSALDPAARKVLVSLGTVNNDRGRRFFDTVQAAFADQPLQIILVAPDEMVPNPVPNIIARSFVPQLALMEHVDAVVSHAGHNTVCEALYHGRPLVVTPIKDDQPVVAGQVVDAGAGLRLRFGRLRAPVLRDAVWRLLREPSFGVAAQTIGASFRAAGGARAAADSLEILLP